ncbi:MAG TPA: glycoside hydrolase family 38 C-terminal domain-containing protein [Terriglobales bacterium]|nr:glycoside hydrolase family 38 C-terminal domain-containing protein [Terriglobales bacterium]
MFRCSARTRSLLPLFLVLALAAGAALAGQQAKPKTPPTLQNPRAYTAHLVGHAHIDLSWLWRWEETVNDIAVQTFKGTLAQMAKRPGLTFAQSQPAVYEAIEKAYPALFEEIKAKVKDGTWIPVGGMWSEPDLNMPDGEALARQLLYGKRYFLDKFGCDVTVGWNPDAFGHNWQLPQVLSKAGIRYYVFERCAPDKTPFFWWEGRDGSRILAYVPPGWYLVDLKDGLSTVLKDAASETAIKDFLILYGAGDHGGGPRDSDVAAIEKYRDDPGQPKMVFSDPAAFFKKIEASGADIPVVRRELNFTFPACYTTQVETKRRNRSSESLLLQAERFSALAVASGFRDYYPERDIDEAWKIVLRNQFHDILDGSAIGPVYDETGRFYREAAARGQRALDFSLETITSQVDTRGEGFPLVVYNPLAWDRSEPALVEVAVPREKVKPGEGTVRIYDGEGTGVRSQILERRVEGDTVLLRVLFMAMSVPSLGYRLYRAVPMPSSPFEVAGVNSADGLVARENEFENAYLKVRLDPKTGWITSLYDKTARREVFSGPANALQSIVDEPESMSAWELGLKGLPVDIGASGATIEVVESGPVRAVLRVKTRFHDSTFEQDLTLYAGLPRLDCRMRLDWQERNLMIKAAFPVNLNGGQAEFEIPYGSATRPADGTEVPALRWVDFSDPAAGAGLSLLNDGKYGFDVMGTTVRMSIIHGATAPDPEADRGRHEFLYALYPHAGTWQDADTVRRGYELGYPLIVRTAMAHKGTLPAVHSFLRASPSNVVLSSLKMESGYNSRSVILRLYEAFGRRTEARVSFPWPVQAVATDLIERSIAGAAILTSAGAANELVVPMGPYEIKTLRVTRVPQ